MIAELVFMNMLIETDPNSGIYLYITTSVFLVLLLLFYKLETTVGQSDVVIKFGIGLIKKTVPISSIKETKEVKNSWWFGWGIRLTPYGWLWNIAGYDAVEILYKETDKKFRIGCKDVSALKNEIDKRL
jgi:hypothetical protein